VRARQSPPPRGLLLGAKRALLLASFVGSLEHPIGIRSPIDQPGCLLTQLGAPAWRSMSDPRRVTITQPRVVAVS
jgi:hypothetical protein